MATCRKRIADVHRKEARRNALWQEFGGSEATLSGTIRAPEVCELDIDRVVMAMGPLSGKERQVINETYSLERSADEIARALGITAAHVRVMRHRAIEKVRAALGFKEGI
jgi:RNA polymerase sigma-70 factor (ECF subfamily)